VGGALKYMYGITYDSSVNVTDVASDEVTSKLEEGDETSSNVGLDLGVLYELPIPVPDDAVSFGLVAKNVNSPGFTTATGGEFKESVQIRGGVAATFFKRHLRASLDFDLTKNETELLEVGGYESQMVGGGICGELLPGLSLRGGLMQNMADSSSGVIYTVGLALGFDVLHLNVGGAFSSKQGQYAGQSYPSDFNIMAALESVW
jgi:hypothetical protein